MNFPFKLVRDGIPQAIRDNGGFCVTRKLGKAAHKKALLVKLVEEAEEVLRAKNYEQRKEELADVLELLLSIQIAFDYSPTEINLIRTKKYVERGGFLNGIFLYFSFGGK